MAELSLKPIGFFKGARTNKTAVTRQGHLSQQSGFIEFVKGFDFKSALQGLEKMSHAWIIFSFHEAKSQAKPLVRPPRSPEIQVGVWATRSPYRPNSLGLSLVKIESVENGKLFVSHVDLLNDTPIFDIKPYVRESDFPRKVKQGWIDDVEIWKYQLSSRAKKKTEWLQVKLPELMDVFENQFGTPPLQPNRKRIKKYDGHYTLSYRTWRIDFTVDNEKRKSKILDIRSGYSPTEMKSAMDPYGDKLIHAEFNGIFNLAFSSTAGTKKSKRKSLKKHR